MNKRSLIALLPALLLLACKEEKEPVGPPTAVITPYALLNASAHAPASHAGAEERSVLTFIGGSYVQTPRSATEMDMPVYPRFIKTTDGRWLLFYHNGSYDASTGKNSWAGSYCWYAESTDLLNWSNPRSIFPIQRSVQSEYDDVISRYYAGVHPVRLADGRLMAVASYRGSKDMRHRTRDNGLAVRFSSDEGKTWTQERRICVGTNWEPRPLVLSSGRVLIYYTDSRPYVEGVWESALVSSGVSYIYSDDNGATWKPDDPFTDHLPAFRQLRDEKNGVKLYTDQMPGVIELAGGKQLVGTGESNMASGSSSTTDYWVSLARSDKNGDWGPADPDPSGELPAGRQDWEKKFTKGAGPQVEQFRSGETLLTYNDNNTFYMRLGNADATLFGDQLRVFEGASPVGRGFWGSAYIDSHIALLGIGGSGGKTGLGYFLQIGRYYLNHDIDAAARIVTVDGNNKEWPATDHALFVGSASERHATLRAAVSGGKLCFLAELDAFAAEAGERVTVYLADPAGESIAVGDVYLRVSPDGELRSCRYSPGWYNAELGAEAAVAKGENCWLAEFSVPLSALPVRGGEVRVNFAVNCAGDGEQAVRPVSSTETKNWCKIKFDE